MKTVEWEIIELFYFLHEFRCNDVVVFQKRFDEKLCRINELSSELPARHRTKMMDLCFSICSYEMDRSILFRQARHKPYGYAGDFLLIDWIYQRKCESLGRGRWWDDFFHRQPATQAVRSLRNYFRDFLSSYLLTEKRQSSVLSFVGCPCREIHDLLMNGAEKTPASEITIFEIEKDAIHYSQNFMSYPIEPFEINWKLGNIFTFEPPSLYDLIYVPGLFNYLSDRTAVALMKRLYHWAEWEGEILIANFHPGNPTRDMMEWCLRWFLYHRTGEQMISLADQAGIPIDNFTLEHEEAPVNLLARIRKV